MAGTTKAGGVVLPPVPAMSARETVTGRGTEVNMTATEAAGRASSVGATTASSSELTSIPRTTAVRDPMGAEVSLCSAMTILRPEWCRLGAVGAVVLLLPLLWGRPVDQEQVLQGPGMSSHNFLSDQNMQQSALPALATVSLCSPRTLPTARLPTSTAWVPSTTSYILQQGQSQYYPGQVHPQHHPVQHQHGQYYYGQYNQQTNQLTKPVNLNIFN